MKKPIILHVSIDSSILRKDRGLDKKDMAFLKELAKLKLVKIHIPWFVYKECTTQNVNEIIKELDAADNHLSDLAKKGLHKDDEIQYKKIRKDIEKQKKRVQASVESVWEEFITDTGAILYPFDPKTSVNVFDSYFTGNAPFRELKARADIPDAFIFETLIQIAKENKLHFICEDKGLRGSAGSIKNVSVYVSFDDFFKSTEFELIQMYYNEHGGAELKRLEFLSFVPSISASLVNEIKRWGWLNYYIDYPYSNDEFVTITSFYDIAVSISNESIKFIAGEFYLEVLIKSKVSLEYFVDKSEAPWEDESRMSLSSWNDYVYLAEEEDVDITIRHTFILPERYLLEEVNIIFNPDDIVDEIVFNHLNERSIINRRRRSDI